MQESMHFEGKDSNDKTFQTRAAGRYQICLDNTMSRWTAKVVSLDVDGQSPHSEWTEVPDAASSSAAAEEVVTKDDLAPVETTITRITRTLDTIADMQHTYRWREVSNRLAADKTASSVLWYSLLVCLVAVVATVAQVFVLKYWFRR